MTLPEAQAGMLQALQTQTNARRAHREAADTLHALEDARAKAAKEFFQACADKKAADNAVRCAGLWLTQMEEQEQATTHPEDTTPGYCCPCDTCEGPSVIRCARC